MGHQGFVIVSCPACFKNGEVCGAEKINEIDIKCLNCGELFTIEESAKIKGPVDIRED